MLTQLCKSREGNDHALFVLTITILMLIIPWLSVFSQNQSGMNGSESLPFTLETWGIEYGVSDIKQAVDFYTEALGFEKEDNMCCEPSTVLKNGSLFLILHQSDASLPSDGTAMVILNMVVGDFDAALEVVRLRGGKVIDETPRQFANGVFVKIYDPSGNTINLLKLDGENISPTNKPTVYNVGVTQQNLEKAEYFYTNLGFRPYSRDYLPKVLPLNQRGAVMLVLHDSAKLPTENSTRKGTILLATRNLEATVHALKDRGLISEKFQNHSNHDFVILRDPSGNQLKLIEHSAELPSNSYLPVQQEWSQLKKNIWQTVEAYTEASHQRDLEKYLSYWHPNFLGWHNGDSKPTNFDQRSKGLQYFFNTTKSLEYKLKPMGIQIVASGNAAIVHYELRNILQIKESGEKKSGLSRWTDYLVKDNGKWLLISDHGGNVQENDEIQE